jgi:hypothetical protein
VQPIYDGILARDLLRNLVAQSLSIVQPLANLPNRSGIFFSFFTSLFAEFQLNCKIVGALLGMVESIWKDSQGAKTNNQKSETDDRRRIC